MYVTFYSSILPNLIVGTLDEVYFSSEIQWRTKFAALTALEKCDVTRTATMFLAFEDQRQGVRSANQV